MNARRVLLLMVILLALTVTPGAAQTTHPDEARIVAVEAIPAVVADGDYVTVWDDGVIEVWDFDAQAPRREVELAHRVDAAQPAGRRDHAQREQRFGEHLGEGGAGQRRGQVYPDLGDDGHPIGSAPLQSDPQPLSGSHPRRATAGTAGARTAPPPARR